MAYDNTRPADAAPDTESRQSEEDFIALALERFNECSKAEDENRRKFLNDLEFYAGDQWPSNIKANRDADDRPCLTINRLPQFVHQVSNQVRQNKPAPKVSPVDSGADVETAEIIQGIYRHIERQSLADNVRSYASFYQVVTGRGYYRILAEHADPLSFDQELYLRRVKNPATVYLDPKAQEPDYSDARYGFIIEDLTRAEFEAQFPGKEAASAEEFTSVGDGEPDWASHDKIRVAEYFYREMEKVSIALLGDGSTVRLEEVPEGTPILMQRTTKIPRVGWAKISCYEVLEQKLWPGQWIPIIPVLGEEFDLDGKTQMVGMVRNAKDPQRMMNYWESAKTETIALAPRSPYIAAEGQLEGHELEWAQANRRNITVLHYKPKSLDGTLVPAPQRQVYEPPIQAITVAESGAVENLKATTGIYDASLGNRTNETSGIAIRQRDMQGEIANYHFLDNLAVAINHEARVIIDLIPKIYDRPGRVVRIIGEDGSEQKVTLNQSFAEQGLEKIYQPGVGRYDVAVDIGPSQKTRRQEAVDAMLGFAQAAPELVPRYADLFVSAMDWPGAQEIADRVRPPDVPPKGGPKPYPPEAQQKITELTQQNQQLTQALDQATQLMISKSGEIAAKERMQTQELESKERVATMQTQEKAAEKLADLGSKEAVALLQADIAALNKRLDLLQANVPVQATEQPPDAVKMANQQLAMQQLMEQQMPQPGPQGPNGQPDARPPLDSFITQD